MLKQVSQAVRERLGEVLRRLRNLRGGEEREREGKWMALFKRGVREVFLVFVYLFILFIYWFMCVNLCVLSVSSFFFFFFSINFSRNLQQGNGAIELAMVMWVLIPGWPNDTIDFT